MSHSCRRRFAATDAPIVGCRRRGGRHGCGHRDGRHRVRVGFDINQNRFLLESLAVRQPSVAVKRPCDGLAAELRWLQTMRRGAEIRTTAITVMHFSFTYAQRSNDVLETEYWSTNLQQDRRKLCTNGSADNLPPLRVPSIWTKWPPTARDACEYYGSGGEEWATARERNLGLDFSFQRRRATVTTAWRTVTAAAAAVASARRPQPSPLPRQAARRWRALRVYLHVHYYYIIIITHNDTTPTSSSLLLLLFFALVPYDAYNTHIIVIYITLCFVIVAQYIYLRVALHNILMQQQQRVSWFGARI